MYRCIRLTNRILLINSQCCVSCKNNVHSFIGCVSKYLHTSTIRVNPRYTVLQNYLRTQISAINFENQKRSTSKFCGYKYFGHGRRKMDAYDAYLYFILILSIFAFLIDSACKGEFKRYKRIITGKAASLDLNEASAANKAKTSEKSSKLDETSNEVNESTLMPPQNKREKNKLTFKERKIIAYENKLRAFSNPEKIFRYFATLKVYPIGEPQYGPNFEVFMTPDDFVRSITPDVMQPEGLGLEQFSNFNPETDKLQTALNRDSVFFKLGKHGLISYTDYIFLLTLLSTSARHFALAFKMFDINGDGELDYNEFAMVENVIRSQSQIGTQHREHVNSGTILRHRTNSSLAAYFFGASLDQKLLIDKFLDFQSHLQRDILRLEFERRKPKNGRLSESNFCKMLLQHSNIPKKRQSQMLKRVKKLYAISRDTKPTNENLNENHSENNATFSIMDERTKKNTNHHRFGVTLEEVEQFYEFLSNINDVETALTFYKITGAQIDARTLQRVAKTVAGVDLPDHIIECVFALFDENQDGELSNKEFVSVMKRRLMRGLERPKDTGFSRVFTSIWHCTRSIITPFSNDAT